MFPIREDINDAKLVIGCIRDTQIHLEQAALELIVGGRYDKLLMLAEVKFMVAAGCGPHWENILSRKVIFGVDENGAPCFVKDGLLQPKVESEPCVAVCDDVADGEVIPSDAVIQ